MLDEVEVDAELQKRRGAQAGYLDSSFPTIAGENQPSTAASPVNACATMGSKRGSPLGGMVWRLYMRTSQVFKCCMQALAPTVPSSTTGQSSPAAGR